MCDDEKMTLTLGLIPVSVNVCFGDHLLDCAEQLQLAFSGVHSTEHFRLTSIYLALCRYSCLMCFCIVVCRLV